MIWFGSVCVCVTLNAAWLFGCAYGMDVINDNRQDAMKCSDIFLIPLLSDFPGLDLQDIGYNWTCLLSNMVGKNNIGWSKMGNSFGAVELFFLSFSKLYHKNIENFLQLLILFPYFSFLGCSLYSNTEINQGTNVLNEYKNEAKILKVTAFAIILLEEQ